jgi:hypothetical protein
MIVINDIVLLFKPNLECIRTKGFPANLPGKIGMFCLVFVIYCSFSHCCIQCFCVRNSGIFAIGEHICAIWVNFSHV